MLFAISITRTYQLMSHSGLILVLLAVFVLYTLLVVISQDLVAIRPILLMPDTFPKYSLSYIASSESHTRVKSQNNHWQVLQLQPKKGENDGYVPKVKTVPSLIPMIRL